MSCYKFPVPACKEVRLYEKSPAAERKRAYTLRYQLERKCSELSTGGRTGGGECRSARTKVIGRLCMELDKERNRTNHMIREIELVELDNQQTRAKYYSSELENTALRNQIMVENDHIKQLECDFQKCACELRKEKRKAEKLSEKLCQTTFEFERFREENVACLQETKSTRSQMSQNVVDTISQSCQAIDTSLEDDMAKLRCRAESLQSENIQLQEQIEILNNEPEVMPDSGGKGDEKTPDLVAPPAETPYECKVGDVEQTLEQLRQLDAIQLTIIHALSTELVHLGFNLTGSVVGGLRMLVHQLPGTRPSWYLRYFGNALCPALRPPRAC